MFYFICAAAALFAVLADQLVKYLIVQYLPTGSDVTVIPGILGLTQLHNPGAAFSILVGRQSLLVGLTFVFFALLVLLIRKKYIRGKVEIFAAALVFGGAVGNLIDRCRFGYVVDMFKTLFIDFPVFNVADIFVVCGGILFCAAALLEKDDRTSAKKAG